MDCADNDYLAYICSVLGQASLISETALGQVLVMVVKVVVGGFMLWKAYVLISDRFDKKRMARRLLELEKDMLISSFQNEDILEVSNSVQYFPLVSVQFFPLFRLFEPDFYDA